MCSFYLNASSTKNKSKIVRVSRKKKSIALLKYESSLESIIACVECPNVEAINQLDYLTVEDLFIYSLCYLPELDGMAHF